jgi:hypothetical protein
MTMHSEKSMEERLTAFYEKHDPSMIPEVKRVMHNIRVRGEAWYHETWMHKYGESIFDSKPEVIMPPKKEATLEDRLTEFYRKHNPTANIPVIMENLRVLGEQWLYDLQMEKYKESVFEKRPERTNALTALEYRLTEFYNKHNPMANIPAIMENIRVLGEQWLYDMQMEKYKESVFEKRPERTITLTALEHRLTEFYNKHNPMANIPAIMENLRVFGEQMMHDAMMEKYGASIFEKRPESSSGTTADHLLEYRLKKFYQTHNQAMIDEIPAMIKGIREYGERHYHMEMMKKYGASIFDYPERSVNAMKTVLEMTKDAMKTVPATKDSKETTSTIETLEERLIATPVTTMIRHAMNTLKIGFIIAMNFILFMLSVRYLYFAYTLGMFGRAACFLNPSCPLSTALGT